MRLEGGQLFIAPVGSDPATGPWRDVGHLVEADGISFSPAVEEPEELFITPARLVTGSITATVRLTGRIRPAMWRLLYGHTPLPRRRVRELTRARYRARARRRR